MLSVHERMCVRKSSKRSRSRTKKDGASCWEVKTCYRSACQRFQVDAVQWVKPGIENVIGLACPVTVTSLFDFDLRTMIRLRH